MKKKAEMTTADFEAEATHEAAIQIAEIEMAKEIASITPQEPTQDKREHLIAEACRMAGVAQGLKISANFSDVSGTLLLKKIQEERIYRDMPGITTFENLCKYVGLSPSKVYEDIANLNKFGSEFLTTVGDLGIGYRELRQLKRAKSDGVFAIEGDSVIIEGEVIPLGEKDDLKEALEELISEQYKKLKAKDEMVKKYAEQQEIAHKAMKQAESEQKKAETERDTFKDKLNTIYQGRLGDVAPADREDFQTIANIEIDFNRVLGAVIRFSDKKVSEFNAQMLCAVISKMMVAVDDIRQKLSAEHRYHFDGGILDKTELDRLSDGDTPQSFLLEK